MAPRELGDLLSDLDEAIRAAHELVFLGRVRWEREQLLRLAGEAVIGRIGDVASKMPDHVLQETEDIPRQKVRGMRIIVDHVYHAVDYNIVWETLKDDVPKLGLAIERWRSLHPEVARDPGRDDGPDLGL